MPEENDMQWYKDMADTGVRFGIWFSLACVLIMLGWWYFKVPGMTLFYVTMCLLLVMSLGIGWCGRIMQRKYRLYMDRE